MKKELSIIIPVFNEKKNIKSLINLIKKYFKLKKEIIIIDDNSTDKTYKLFEKKKFLNIRYFLRKEKNSFMKSCYLGIENAKYENILIMDGDLQHHPKFIMPMFKLLSNKKDIVVGVRNFKKNPGLNFIRKLSSKLLVLFVNLLLGKKTSDPMSGFILFKKKIFDINRKNYFNHGFKIILNLIYINKFRKNLIDYPIIFYKRKKNISKMNVKILFLLVFQIFYLLKFK